MQGEIKQLIDEYNATEAQQAERLRTLFYLLKARKGYRHIRFAGADMLSNCWALPDRLDGEKYLNRYNRAIVDVCEGNP